MSDPRPAPSRGHLVPPPRCWHGASSADPLVCPHAAVPRVVRLWSSFRVVTRWSGLVALCPRCQCVVCLAGGQRDLSCVAWMTGGSAPLPLVTESALAVHEVIFLGFVLNRRGAAGHRSEHKAVYFKSITKPPLSALLTAGRFYSLTPSSCPPSPAWAPSRPFHTWTSRLGTDVQPEPGSRE